jgi:hypothetical protein
VIPPEPPVDVRLVLTDGTEVPVQTVYLGVQRKLHTWGVVEPVPYDRFRGVKIGMLPPQTTVAIQVPGQE